MIRFAGTDDPVKVMQQRSRKVVDKALGEGLNGPPFDLFELLKILGIRAVPRHDVVDARIVPAEGENKFVLEYNPKKSIGRMRFSIAHEIAHTLFPDCGDAIRNREHQPTGTLREVETLCNIGAAEILMPLESLPDELTTESLSFDKIQLIQKKLQVSLEALLIRLVRLSQARSAVFCVSDSRVQGGKTALAVDYVLGSANWRKRITHGRKVPATSRLANIASIGWTEKSDGEAWSVNVPFEAMGLPPFPGSARPRIVGLLIERESSGSNQLYREIVGDATEVRVRDNESAILVQLVNDRARTWGGRGFSTLVKSKWPAAQESFTDWAASNLDLGAVHFARIAENVYLASLVAQKGYGASKTPRISYSSLRTALERVKEKAASVGASVHMPRIGSGQAGGSWPVISHLVKVAFTPHRIPVTVYSITLNPRQVDLPLEFG